MSAPAPESSCAVKPAIAPKPKTVSVNGVAIARAAIARETQNHPAAKPIEAWQAAARALVIRELLLQEARRLALAPEPLSDDEGRRETDEEALIRQVVEREVATPEADEAACQRYYDNNRQRFRSGDLVEARHILLPAAPGDHAARAQAKEQADAIIVELQKDKARFSAIAETLSACPSAKVGGSLGQIGPGQTVPEFERALGRLPVGEIAPHPIETRYGFHVVLVERRIEGRELPFDMVRARIAVWLNEKVRRVAVQQYLAILAARADISGVDMSASPAQPA